jgi:sensor c-di-GMP phosphodiesterase-like protein
VVAEGIEDQTQADVIRSLGVALGQGYHFARPMPLPALAEWLDAQPRLVSRTPGR